MQKVHKVQLYFIFMNPVIRKTCAFYCGPNSHFERLQPASEGSVGKHHHATLALMSATVQNRDCCLKPDGDPTDIDRRTKEAF